MWTLEAGLVVFVEGTCNPELRSIGLSGKVFNGISHVLLTVLEGVPVKSQCREASAIGLGQEPPWI